MNSKSQRLGMGFEGRDNRQIQIIYTTLSTHQTTSKRRVDSNDTGTDGGKTTPAFQIFKPENNTKNLLTRNSKQNHLLPRKLLARIKRLRYPTRRDLALVLLERHIPVSRCKGNTSSASHHQNPKFHINHRTCVWIVEQQCTPHVPQRFPPNSLPPPLFLPHQSSSPTNHQTIPYISTSTSTWA